MSVDDRRLSPISIDFERGGTLYPLSVSFQYHKDEFDFLTCKFDIDTANRIQEYLDSTLSNPQRATVLVDGKPVRMMYYEPDFFRLGSTNEEDGRDWPGYLELHDLHESLEGGTVNYAPKTTTLKDTYRRIFRARDDKETIKSLEFSIPQNPRIYRSDNDTAFAFDGNVGIFAPFEIDFGYSINFDKISPLEAIEKANNVFGVSTHISPDGDLVVGQYEGETSYTASDTGSGSNLHISSASMTNTSNKIKQLTIEGPKEKPSTQTLGLEGTTEKISEWLNQRTDNDVGFRTQVVVENLAVDSGKTATIQAHNAERGELRDLAKRQYRRLESQRTRGTISVSQNTSNRYGPFFIGDGIEVAEPLSSGGLKKPAYSAGDYYVAGISHRYQQSWTSDVEVFQIPSDPADLNVTLRYIDISSGQEYTHEELYGTPLE